MAPNRRFLLETIIFRFHVEKKQTKRKKAVGFSSPKTIKNTTEMYGLQSANPAIFWMPWLLRQIFQESEWKTGKYHPSHHRSVQVEPNGKQLKVPVLYIIGAHFMKNLIPLIIPRCELLVLGSEIFMILAVPSWPPHVLHGSQVKWCRPPRRSQPHV